MLRTRRLVGLAGLLSLLALFGTPALQSQNAPKKPGGCVDVTTEASYASIGYDHIVTLKSECKKTMDCTVKTDVNPDPTSVTLAPGETQSVVTWRGSPARVFTADVSCSPSAPAKN